MKPIAKYLALGALLLTIGPPTWFMLGRLNSADPEKEPEVVAAESESTEDASDDQSTMKALMLGGAILWFVSAPQWLREDD